MEGKDNERSGELGDCSEQQLEVLNDFKKWINKEHLASPIIDDWTCLRFCRARKFKLSDIIIMFKNYVDKMNHFKASKILTIDMSNIEKVVEEYYEHGYCGISKDGLPVNIDRMRKFDSYKIAAKVTVEEWQQYCVRTQLTTLNVIFPYCSMVAKRRIDKSVQIIDLDGFNVKPVIFDSFVRDY